ncbi:MAG: cytochrome b/b6 domain-containing protein [Pseudomonadota bacterium]
MTYSRTTRILHALIALTITFQLIVSLVMEHPSARRPMSQAGAFWFEWHEWVGLAAMAVLLASWIYRLANFKREGQGQLFPWMNATGRRALMTETRHFMTLKWKTLADTGALAGTIHGLGLLIATAMAVTGSILYIGLWPNDVVTPNVGNMMEVHSTLATIMWIYLYGHVIIAVWHQFVGHGTIAKMFSWR